MRVPEAVRVDLTERFRIAVGGELVDRRNRVVAEPFGSFGHRRAARIDPQDRGDDRIEALGLAGIVRVRPPAVAEREVADADVEQAVVGGARLRGRVEFDVADRMKQVGDDVSDAKDLPPRPLEGVRRRVGGVPFRDDVVEGHVRFRESRRDEVGARGVPHHALGVGRVEQSVPREVRMEIEADEPAGQAVVDRERERRADIRVDGRLVVAIEQVQQAARVVHEPAAVRQIAEVTGARPSGRHHVLSGGTKSARVGETHDVPYLDGSGRAFQPAPGSDWQSARTVAPPAPSVSSRTTTIFGIRNLVCGCVVSGFSRTVCVNPSVSVQSAAAPAPLRARPNRVHGPRTHRSRSEAPGPCPPPPNSAST